MYAGASINISVKCDRNVFLDKHPEYNQEPYVILKCCRGRFREQVMDGQAIYCAEEPGIPNLNRKRESGTVGYWIPDQHADNTSLGITAFHVLDSITEYSGIDDEKKFTRYKENCSSDVLRTSDYAYLLESNGERKCTYVCGVYDNSVDVGVVRCTNRERGNDQGNERIGCNSFQWPGILYDMVVEEKRELVDVLWEYQLHFLKQKEQLCIFHNGQSSREERKVGKLSGATAPIVLGKDEDENLMELSNNAILVKGVRSDANRSFCLSVDALEKLSTIWAEDSEDSEYVASSSYACIDSEISVEHVDLGTSQYGEIREQTFTAGGDSGCVYFIDCKTKNQLILKAPIGIHRGVYDEEEESEDKQKSLSVASAIDASLQNLKEDHDVNLWFPIGDQGAVKLANLP